MVHLCEKSATSYYIYHTKDKGTTKESFSYIYRIKEKDEGGKG
jgi:hypothetical protein